MTNDERDWRDALSGIHDEIRDVRDDVAQVRSELGELRRSQEFEKAERLQQREDHKLLHFEHKELASEVGGIHNDVDLLKENIRLTQMLNEKTHDVMGDKIDTLTHKFDKHAEQEERDRREVISALKGENFQIRRFATKDIMWLFGVGASIVVSLFGLLWATGAVGT